MANGVATQERRQQYSKSGSEEMLATSGTSNKMDLLPLQLALRALRASDYNYITSVLTVLRSAPPVRRGTHPRAPLRRHGPRPIQQSPNLPTI